MKRAWLLVPFVALSLSACTVPNSEQARQLQQQESAQPEPPRAPTEQELYDQRTPDLVQLREVQSEAGGAIWKTGCIPGTQTRLTWRYSDTLATSYDPTCKDAK